MKRICYNLNGELDQLIIWPKGLIINSKDKNAMCILKGVIEPEGSPAVLFMIG